MVNKESAPQVSVITANLNGLEGLRKSVESVRSQEGIRFEHIVIDGGSVDGSTAWLESQGDSVRWRTESDEGIADAMNKGVSLARGEWLLFLQADDRMASVDTLRDFVRKWDNKADIVAGNIQFESGRILVPRFSRWYYRRFKQGLLHQGVLIRFDFFKKLGMYSTDFAVTMDFDWFLRAIWAKARIQKVDVLMAIMGDNGISSRTDRASLFERYREEQRARMRNAPSVGWSVAYSVYYIFYIAFRRVFFFLRG